MSTFARISGHVEGGPELPFLMHEIEFALDGHVIGRYVTSTHSNSFHEKIILSIVRLLVPKVHPVPTLEHDCINGGRISKIQQGLHRRSVQYRRSVRTGWTHRVRIAQTLAVIPPRPTLKIEKLSDNFGQFVITLRCECGHTRNASPKTFAGIAGWDAKLADVVKRARCSKCGKRGRCTVNVRHELKRDG